MVAILLIGDVFKRMAQLEDGSVDLIVTSPPFLALRSYLAADHPDKGREIGSEATPADYLDTLLAVTAEWRRVLARHGSIAVELGDTYAGSGGGGGDYDNDGMRDGQNRFRGSASRSGWHRLGARADQSDQPPNYRKHGTSTDSGSPSGGEGWPLPKSLCGMPTLYAWSLAYGRNLLTGEESPAGRWRVRNLVAWVRPNPPVGALADKFRPATSYVTVATLARDRWFDLDAVRGEPSPNTHARTARGVSERPNDLKSADDDRTGGNWSTLAIQHATAGAPPLDWWNIPPGGYSGAHYAVFPPELPKRLIASMCPHRVCTVCDQPSRRIVEREHVRDAHGGTSGARRDLAGPDGRTDGTGMTSKPTMAVSVSTLGWSDCGHDAWRPGLVCDPFAGSGTTLAVATGMGRDAIGIDIDLASYGLALGRVGPMLFAIDWPAANWALASLPRATETSAYAEWEHMLGDAAHQRALAEAEGVVDHDGERQPEVARRQGNGRRTAPVPAPVLAGQLDLFPDLPPIEEVPA